MSIEERVKLLEQSLAEAKEQAAKTDRILSLLEDPNVAQLLDAVMNGRLEVRAEEGVTRLRLLSPNENVVVGLIASNDHGEVWLEKDSKMCAELGTAWFRSVGGQLTLNGTDDRVLMMLGARDDGSGAIVLWDAVHDRIIHLPQPGSPVDGLTQHHTSGRGASCASPSSDTLEG